MSSNPQISVIMGSKSDFPTMQKACEILDILEVPYETLIVSAHRTPERMFEFAKSAEGRGVQAIIAGAGGAAHLPGMVASLTKVPVLGVPIESKSLKGLDSLLSIVQMPGGIPVATFAIGEAGAKNAAIFAAAIISLKDKKISEKLDKFRKDQTESIAERP
jgi:5-(carboxyamino)imidazole ribonucleotide mutase